MHYTNFTLAGLLQKTDEVVPVGLPFLRPEAADVLRLARNSAKLLFELQDRLGQQFVRDGIAAL